MFLARAMIDFCSRASGWRPSATPRSRPMGRTRITGRTGGTRKAGGSVAARRNGSRPEVPEGVVSVTDPDTQRIKARLGYVQRYNAQAVVDEGQIVLAAEITVHAHETVPVPRLTLPQSPFRQFGHEVFCFGQLGRQDQPP
jgi:hypothetical protein